MGLDQTSLDAQLTAIQAQILVVLAAPAGMWRVGQVEFDQSRYLDYLRQLQNDTIKLMRSTPSESIDTIQNGVGALGNDWTEYLGEQI
jgi:hypothetical protein